MASFDPLVVLAIIVAAQEPGKRKKFEEEYKRNVARRVATWTKNRTNQSCYEPQLQFEAHVAEYVTFLHGQTRPTRTTKTSNTVPKAKPLAPSIPIYGPKFTPPSFVEIHHRGGKISPEIAYLRPIHIVHPVYYPLLAKCPHCGSQDIAWDSWNGTGSREVHGVRREETALGYQLRHEACVPDEGGVGTKNRSFVTTNPAFWKKWEHWEIPRGIPYFLSRSAVTRELFDIIAEFRPSTTSGGLAENIKQLHLLEYHEHSLEYLQAYQESNFKPGTIAFPRPFIPFSAPTEEGYDDTPITDDLIRDVYMGFVERTRRGESSEYLRNLTPGICLSTDNTFKVAGKATVVDSSKARTKLMKGGILSMLNELNEIIAWRFCQSASPAEMFEVLLGIKKRCEELGVELPSMLVSDDCCKIEKEAHKAMPDLQICLDVYHFMMRYLAAVLNGTQNPRRGAVAADIRNAVLKKSAAKGAPAEYWPKEVQEAKMVDVYNRYSRMGGVWSAAAHAVHAAQLKHLRKGCLSRLRQDIASDGSRIEGSHKGWNGIQRAVASGLELQASLCHDFVLRRNLRIAFSRKPGTAGSHEFVRAGFGSHHTRLVNQTAILSNDLHAAARPGSSVPIESIRPTLRDVQSGEEFGLVTSNYSDTFGGLLAIKTEDEEDKILAEVLDTTTDPELVLAEFGIDPALLQQPEIPQHSTPAAPLSPAQLEASDSVRPSTKRKETDTPALTDPHTPADTADEIPQSKKPRLSGDMTISNMPSTAKPVHPFFASSSSGSAASPMNSLPNPSHPTIPASSHTSASLAPLAPTLADLRKPLPLPPTNAGLTDNPKALEICRGMEFFLFMDMRSKFGWKASSMTSKRWADAVGKYNERLLSSTPDAVAKSPRALIAKLGEVERMVLDRIATNDFTARTSGRDGFWKHHCSTIQLVKTQATGSGVSSEGKQPRKDAVCLRCNRVMYPGSSGSPENHKKGYCSDGFKQNTKNSGDNLAPWPQPAGIFTSGSEFHPFPFLLAIRTLYEKVIVEKNHESLTVEDEAFSLMINQPGRMVAVNGAVLFKLFPSYEIPAADGVPDSILVKHEEINYLRVDSLADTETSFSSQ
ncbi:hypothetical protein R3P38DRAFT_3297859 [Favolaschia claudopus]|uniref:Transposase n=1 Tax=Favolaschia claudopus TaxID=2862362 RepID=A0AAV9Z5B5_9AGAR